jgi:hypothetical protein
MGRAGQAGGVVQELIHTMTAGVAGEDSLAAVPGKVMGEVSIPQESAQPRDQLGAVAGEGEVSAGTEELIAVFPGGCQQRPAAGQGLEEPAGRTTQGGF